MKVQRCYGKDALCHLERMVEISEAAFSRPPFRLALGHRAMLRDFLVQSDAWCYRVGWPSGEGFGIGTVLNPQTIKRYSAAQLIDCTIGDYHLTWRAVDPDAQNRGVGTALMSSRIAHARELRCKRVIGDTDLRNWGTRRLFTTLGFTERGKIPLLRNGQASFRLFYVLEL